MTPDGKVDVAKTDAAFKAALPSTAPKPYMDLFNKIVLNCTSSVPGIIASQHLALFVENTNSIFSDFPN
jgi:hypothetical protein